MRRLKYKNISLADRWNVQSVKKFLVFVCNRGTGRCRKNPREVAEEWLEKEEDPPDFTVQQFEKKGRGVVTVVNRQKGDFLLIYRGEVLSGEEGEMREEVLSTGYRFFYKAKGKKLCVDATEESGHLGRLVNHGGKKERNTVMKEVLGQLCLFTIRRGNECAAMQVKKFTGRANWKMGNTEIYNSLSKFEGELAKRMDLVEVMGKQNKKVPVLLTRNTKNGIDLLINNRDRCGIDVNNQYVFAKGSNTFIEGCKALGKTLQSIPNLKRPEALKFPTLRKYFATVVQVFGMKETELQEVARHMGHELSVHRKFYRLQDDVIELAKVAKLLLAVESGKAADFTGKSLDDLDVNELQVDDENDFGQEILAEQFQVEPALEEPVLEETIPAESVTRDITTSNSGLSAKQTMAMVQPVASCSSVVEDKDSKIIPECRKSDFEFEDSGSDSEFRPAEEDDSSDTDVDMPPGKKQKVTAKKKWTTVTAKKKWTKAEKNSLGLLVNRAVIGGKPPKKEDIIKVKKQCPELKNLPWLKIKHQVWAMAQQKNKVAKHMLSK